jgi:hypothetical protein
MTCKQFEILLSLLGIKESYLFNCIAVVWFKRAVLSENNSKVLMPFEFNSNLTLMLPTGVCSDPSHVSCWYTFQLFRREICWLDEGQATVFALSETGECVCRSDVTICINFA